MKYTKLMGCNKGSGSKTLRFRWRREPRLIQQLTLLGSGLESKSPGSDDKQIPLPVWPQMRSCSARSMSVLSARWRQLVSFHGVASWWR